MLWLDVLWRDEAFRSALADLLSLPPSLLTRLRQLTSGSFDLPSGTAAEFQLDESRFNRALAAARTLYQTAREEGDPEVAVVAELRRIASASTDPKAKELALSLDAKRDLLLELLAARPAYDRDQRRDLVQRLALPALEEVGFFVDLRTTRDPATNEVKLVPVVLARLGFDEPIQAGGGALSFQVPDSALAALRNQLDQLGKTLDDVRSRLTEQLL